MGQPDEFRRSHQIRSQDIEMDRIPFPHSGSGNALRFPARTRRQAGNYSAVFAGAKSGAHELPQQGRLAGAQAASAAAGTGAGAIVATLYPQSLLGAGCPGLCVASPCDQAVLAIAKTAQASVPALLEPPEIAS